MYSPNDFILIREGILKNHILNKLLIESFNSAYPVFSKPFPVGTSIIRLTGKSRSELAKKKEKLPNYIYATVQVKMSNPSFVIGYSYPGIPDVWGKVINWQSNNRIANLKFLSTLIFTTYPPVASHIDKIFSEIPKSLCLLLEQGYISRDFWKTSLSRSIKHTTGDINEEELNEYAERLKVKLLDVRIFNSILIDLLKKGKFEKEVPDVGKLTINKIDRGGTLCMAFIDYESDAFNSMIWEYPDLTPLAWESSDFMPGLRKLFNAQLR